MAEWRRLINGRGNLCIFLHFSVRYSGKGKYCKSGGFLLRQKQEILISCTMKKLLKPFVLRYKCLIIAMKSAHFGLLNVEAEHEKGGEVPRKRARDSPVERRLWLSHLRSNSQPVQRFISCRIQNLK
jgi:hypothetical protein